MSFNKGIMHNTNNMYVFQTFLKLCICKCKYILDTVNTSTLNHSAYSISKRRYEYLMTTLMTSCCYTISFQRLQTLQLEEPPV